MQLQNKQQKEKSQENSCDVINHRPTPRKTLTNSEKMNLLTACIDRIKSSKDAKIVVNKKSNDSKNNNSKQHNNNNHHHEIKAKPNKTEIIADKNIVKEKKKRGRKKKIS